MGRKLKSFLLLISLVATVILMIQNRQLITIFILNRPLNLVLPLGIWVIIFIMAGLLTSIVIQWLNPVQVIPIADNNYPKNLNSSNNDLQDEEETQWNIEEPPIEPTTIRDAFNPSVREENFRRSQREQEFNREQEFKSEETPDAEPKQSYNPESRKSPRYDINKESNSTSRSVSRNRKDGVYDANYRVINPPYNPPSEPSYNDEDFDF
jgi:hypothetical protein